MKAVDPAIDRPWGDKQALGHLRRVFSCTQPEQRLRSLQCSGVMRGMDHLNQSLLFFVGKGYQSHRCFPVLGLSVNDSL
jgi:hypothetical protein